MQARHATWVADLADEVAAGFPSPEEPRLVALVDDRLAEIVAAHAWALEAGDADVALRIAVGIARPMTSGIRGDLAEIVEATVEQFGDRTHVLASQAWAHVAAWRVFVDDREAAIEAMAHAVVAAEAAGRTLPVAWWR